MRKEICAIWVLDEETNQKLNKLKEVLRKYGIKYSPIYGHITFANFTDIDEDEILEYTKKFAEGKKSFYINCSVLGLLTTNCIACIPSVSRNLIKYYEEFHQQFDSSCNMWTRADSELWVPHISLHQSETDDLGAIIGEMSKGFVRFKGKIIKIELSVVRENDFEIIYSKDLEE